VEDSIDYWIAETVCHSKEEYYRGKYITGLLKEQTTP
jgi:hypothetical protein